MVLAPPLSPDQDVDGTALAGLPDLVGDDDGGADVDPTEEVHHVEASGSDRTSLAKKRKKKGVKLSRHGVEYPSLPPAVIKRLAQTFARSSGIKSQISSDTLAALTQASDWFLEQVSDDLAAYAKHAGRKTIDDSDMLTLMRR
jgi:histone H3/H4